MNLSIDNLVIEVTRKCNMKCEHCLRGNAQRKVIENRYIYKLLQLVDNVSTLTITGGEPTLAFESMEYIEQCIRYGNSYVGNFYVVSNGKSICVPKVAEWIYRMFGACKDNELSAFCFSFDSYHKETFNWEQLQKQKRNFERLGNIVSEEYGLYRCGDMPFVSEHSDEKWNINSIIKEGRAADWGTRDKEPQPFILDSDDDDFRANENELYLSSNGYIVAGCDWSYHSIDNRKDIRICHIDEINCKEDLIKAIKKYNQKIKRKIARQEKIAV